MSGERSSRGATPAGGRRRGGGGRAGRRAGVALAATSAGSAGATANSSNSTSAATSSGSAPASSVPSATSTHPGSALPRSGPCPHMGSRGSAGPGLGLELECVRQRPHRLRAPGSSAAGWAKQGGRESEARRAWRRPPGLVAGAAGRSRHRKYRRHPPAGRALATVCTRPSRATSRAGRRRADSHSWARRPRIIAAGARGAGEGAGCGRDGHRPPERRGGSPGPRIQDVRSDIGATPSARGGVLDAASPPSRMATTVNGPRGGSSGWPVTSCTRIRQPPAGNTRPATAMSPPTPTRTPQRSVPASRAAQRSAAHAFTVAPGRRRIPAGQRQPPGAGIQPHLLPASRRVEEGGQRGSRSGSTSPGWPPPGRAGSASVADRWVQVAVGEPGRA